MGSTDPAGRPAESASRVGAGGTGGSSAPVILVIDDDQAFRAILGEILAAMGVTAELVSSADSAETWLRSRQPDLILTDIRLPDRNGLALVERLRRRRQTRRTPIVVVSANGHEHDAQRSIACGADAYLAKPFSRDELTRTISNYLFSS
jgi:CheY-like chemotaxis protein